MLSVCVPVLSEMEKSESEEMFLKRLIANSIPEEFRKSALVLESSALPSGRLFRETWVVSGNLVKVDMEKARRIHLEKIRVARNAKLDALDRDEMSAMSRGDDTALAFVRAAKNILRDLPSFWKGYLEGADTPEGLDGMWPVELDRRNDANDW